ncbi:MAG: hypothetical protein O3C26_04250 [Actinomycetota bacterium]|nr:hypothetical protein [Actinomycetota bacterium]
MHSKIDEESKPFLWFPHLLSEKSSPEVAILKLEIDKFSKDFEDFSLQVLTQYNSLFKVGTKTPRSGGDEFYLSLWPNFTILKENNPFRIAQDSNFQDRNGDTAPENFHRKEFTFFIFFDRRSVGKLHIIKRVGSKAEYKEIVDLGIGINTEIGFILWSLCSSNPEIKSAVIVRAKFCAGNLHLDDLLVTLPRTGEAAKIALLLAKVEL